MSYTVNMRTKSRQPERLAEAPAQASLAAPSGSPVRIQLSRKKGWKLPPNTVVVSRPTRWGNPWKVRKGKLRQLTDDASQAEAVEAFKMMLADGQTPPFALVNIREELAGKNLACWCKLGTPCHADVLLKLANAHLENAELCSVRKTT